MGRWRNMGRGRVSRSACSAAYVQSSARVVNACSASAVLASVAHLMHCAANSRYSRAVYMKNLPEADASSPRLRNADCLKLTSRWQSVETVEMAGGIKILLVDRAADLPGWRRRARLWTTPTDWAAEPLPLPPRRLPHYRRLSGRRGMMSSPRRGVIDSPSELRAVASWPPQQREFMENSGYFRNNLR